MFTGIIEQAGSIEKITASGTNRSFWINSGLAASLKIDQSVSHNGVCLTIEEISGDSYRVTAIEETLSKTNLSAWETGSVINLERCLQMNGRIDGHLVQGHVDTVATCTGIKHKEGSWEFSFKMDKEFASFIIEKGSITLNGISLTIFNVKTKSFKVAIIPYTYEHTNMNTLKKGDQVNIEFDMIGKYVNRILQLNK